MGHGMANSTRVQIRRDPIGAAIVVLTVAAFAVACGLVAEHLLTAAPAPQTTKPAPQTTKPADEMPRPPASWLAQAQPGDVLAVPGHVVHYWGRPVDVGPDAEPVIGIVTHHTSVDNAVRLAQNLHDGDKVRRGHFGYHVLVDSRGRIVQAAPLRYRTHHIKPPGARQRRPGRAKWESANTVSVSLVGACKPRAGSLWSCRQETVTPAQVEAAVAAVAALRRRFGLPCSAIAGHGDLQTDRASFEGRAIVEAVAASCAEPPAADQMMALGARH